MNVVPMKLASTRQVYVSILATPATPGTLWPCSGDKFWLSLALTFPVVFWFEVDVWWELATLICVMLLGHWLEMKAIAQAQSALGALAALLPDSAERVTELGVEKVPLAKLLVGDVVLVRPGSRVPADGTVLEGTADVDESMITGESRAISKALGAAVAEIFYAYKIVMDPTALTVGDALILHSLGAAWSKQGCQGDCAPSNK